MNLCSDAVYFAAFEPDDLPQANRPATEGRDDADDLPSLPVVPVLIAEAKLPRRSAFAAVAPMLIAEAKLPRRDLRSRATGGRDAY